MKERIEQAQKKILKLGKDLTLLQNATVQTKMKMDDQIRRDMAEIVGLLEEIKGKWSE